MKISKFCVGMRWIFGYRAVMCEEFFVRRVAGLHNSRNVIAYEWRKGQKIDIRVRRCRSFRASSRARTDRVFSHHHKTAADQNHGWYPGFEPRKLGRDR